MERLKTLLITNITAKIGDLHLKLSLTKPVQKENIFFLKYVCCGLRRFYIYHSNIVSTHDYHIRLISPPNDDFIIIVLPL